MTEGGTSATRGRHGALVRSRPGWSRRRTRFRQLLLAGAHLFVLSAFALAQPLFDLLSRNAEFFAVRGSTRLEILVFSVGIVVVPPASLFLVEAIAGAVDERARQALHLVFVAVLTALVVLQVVKRASDASGSAPLVVAGVVGAALALVYARATALRSFLTVLTPAPLVFAALFLFNSPVSKLVLTDTEPARAASVDSRTPVVLVVFDELSTISLMDDRRRIDAGRYPNFAALARDATWFRNATTVNAHTEKAVPAIYTGRRPQGDELPIAADYPRSIFTLLGGSYRMQVRETLTRICPVEVCDDSATDAPLDERLDALASDLGVAYLHIVLPAALAARLPPVDQTWMDFHGRSLGGDEEEEPTGGTSRIRACGGGICDFADTISATHRPTLWSLHALLPHVPWHYLPSGRRYLGDVRNIPGTTEGRWANNEWLTVQGYQRYLLQLGYTDRALGIILDRLHASGLYDRSLVVVAADHGLSFQPGEPRRNLSAANFPDIAFMPLFVKPPGQRSGRISDGFARTIDILPTIADVLDVFLPWRVDGRSLLAGRLPADGKVAIPNQGGEPVEASLSSLLPRRSQALRRQLAIFGMTTFAPVYRIGPYVELLGRRRSSVSLVPGSGRRVVLDGSALLGSVDPSSALSPAYVTGTITGSGSSGGELAVVVNDTIAAVTRTYDVFGETRFAAIVPETSFRAGPNAIDVLAVRVASGELVLEELERSTPSYTLETRGDAEVIAGPGETFFRVEAEALSGEVRARARSETVQFGGWAADLRRRRAAESVLVLVDGSAVYVGRAGNQNKKDITARYGIEQPGFRFELPAFALPRAGREHTVRVFAIDAGVASELRYAPGYPWP